MIDLSKKEFIVQNPNMSDADKISMLSEMVDELTTAFTEQAKIAKTVNELNAKLNEDAKNLEAKIRKLEADCQGWEILCGVQQKMLHTPDDGILDLALAVGVGTDELREL